MDKDHCQNFLNTRETEIIVNRVRFIQSMGREMLRMKSEWTYTGLVTSVIKGIKKLERLREFYLLEKKGG